MKSGIFTLIIAQNIFVFFPSQTHAQINPQKDTLAAVKSFENKSHTQHRFFKAVEVPGILIATGIYVATGNHIRYAVREERNEHLSNFKHGADNYLMHVPIIAVYGLNRAGIKGKNDFANRTALLVKSEMIMVALAFSLKEITHVQRPDGTTHDSFPSGHTAQAFATATFMAKEYNDQSMWESGGANSMATAVGVMRVLNNRHWVSDILSGAGIGILSTNLAYLTHRYKWGHSKKTTLTVIPTYSRGPGIYLGYSF
jgi:hypothetical protein